MPQEKQQALEVAAIMGIMRWKEPSLEAAYSLAAPQERVLRVHCREMRNKTYRPAFGK